MRPIENDRPGFMLTDGHHRNLWHWATGGNRCICRAYGDVESEREFFILLLSPWSSPSSDETSQCHAVDVTSSLAGSRITILKEMKKTSTFTSWFLLIVNRSPWNATHFFFVRHKIVERSSDGAWVFCPNDVLLVTSRFIYFVGARAYRWHYPTHAPRSMAVECEEFTGCDVADTRRWNAQFQWNTNPSKALHFDECVTIRVNAWSQIHEWPVEGGRVLLLLSRPFVGHLQLNAWSCWFGPKGPWTEQFNGYRMPSK